MRRLVLLPLITLAFACSESSILQPEAEMGSAASVAPRTVLNFQLLENDDNDWGEQSITPSGILHVKYYSFGYDVVGDLVGSQQTVGGVFMVNLRNGKGTASGTFLFDLTEPGVGTFECSFHLSVEDFPVHLQTGTFYSCEGTGDFAGSRMRGTFSNLTNPGVGNFEATAEIW